MRNLIYCLVAAALSLGILPASAQDAPRDVKGLFLLTDYPAVTVRPGTTSTVPLRLPVDRESPGSHLVGKSLELFSVGEVGKPLEGVADYSLDAEVGLRYKVTDWASLNMKAEKDIVSGAEGDLDETRYTLGFGVGW